MNDPHGYRALSSVTVNGVNRDVFSLARSEVVALIAAITAHGSDTVFRVANASYGGTRGPDPFRCTAHPGQPYVTAYCAAHAELHDGSPFAFFTTVTV